MSENKQILVPEQADLVQDDSCQQFYQNDESRHQTEAALLNISELANSKINLSDFYLKLHQIISELIHSENFCIAVKYKNSIRFEYYKDSKHDVLVEELNKVSLTKMKKTLIYHILKQQKSFLKNDVELNEMAKKWGVEIQGQVCKSWLSVPLVIDGEMFGLVVLQSHKNDYRFTEKIKK